MTDLFIQLEASNASLAECTDDFGRLANVLGSKRHFDLVSEQEIRSARDHLSAEIAPQLKELILRAEEALQRDERRVKTLKGKVGKRIRVQLWPQETDGWIPITQVGQQNGRLEQFAQLYDVSVEQLRNRRQAGTGQQTEASTAQADTVSRADLPRLRERAQALQRKREEMHREMGQLEEEVKQSRSTRR